MTRILILLTALILSEQATAQMMMDGPLMGMWRADAFGNGKQNSLQTYFEDSFPASGSLGVDEFGARINSALLHQDQDTYSARASFDDLQVKDAWTVPAWTYGPAFNVPRSLQSINLGSGWERSLKNGDTIGASLGFGSESDRPFATWDETTMQVTALYRMPYGPHSTWTFFLNYSNNRTFLNGIPIPGAIYSYIDREQRLALMVGFPILFVSYGLTEFWDLRASYFVPHAVTLETGYKFVAPSLRLFARFEVQERPFLQVNREAPSEQLFFQRSRLGVGGQMPVASGLIAEILTGYEFGREFYEAYERNESGSVTLPDDWFARAQLTYHF